MKDASSTDLFRLEMSERSKHAGDGQVVVDANSRLCKTLSRFLTYQVVPKPLGLDMLVLALLVPR